MEGGEMAAAKDKEGAFAMEIRAKVRYNRIPKWD